MWVLKKQKKQNYLPLVVHHSRWTRRKFSWLWWPVLKVSLSCSRRKPSRKRCSPRWTLRPGKLWTGTVHLEKRKESQERVNIWQSSQTRGTIRTFAPGVIWRTHFDCTTASQRTPSISKARLHLTCWGTEKATWRKVLKIPVVHFNFTDLF